ncbi:hypothetical protein C0991_002390 [Blastosporella zonata]|nr:hypothetical protein C0991_002390 [Blastosporella zonata]
MSDYPPSYSLSSVDSSVEDIQSLPSDWVGDPYKQLSRPPTPKAIHRSNLPMRMFSHDMPGDCTPILRTAHYTKLQRDLVERKTTQVADKFYSIFSRTVKDTPVKEFLMLSKGCFTYQNKEGQECFPNVGLLQNEQHVAEFLNEIVTRFHYFDHKNGPPTPLGYWSHAKSTTPIHAGRTKGKPDLILLPVYDKSKLQHIHARWADVMAVGELTSTRDYNKDHKNTSASRAYHLLYTQGDRDYVTTFTMNRLHFHVQVYDREGLIEIGPMSYQEHFTEFLTLILSLSYLRNGYDSTMCRQPIDKVRIQHLFFTRHKSSLTPKVKYSFKTSSSAPVIPCPEFGSPEISGKRKALGDGRVFTSQDLWIVNTPNSMTAYHSYVRSNLQCNIATITCNQNTYKVQEEIFRSQSLTGRATRVWKALDSDNKLVIIKESWIYAAKTLSEAEFLKYCQAIKFLALHNRFHRDISLGNLMVYKVKTSEADVKKEVTAEEDKTSYLVECYCMSLGKRGMLIDFDNASFINPPGGASSVPNSTNQSIQGSIARTGTPPFMAIPLLMSPNSAHRVAYDLESLFYVLIYLVTQITAFAQSNSESWTSEISKSIKMWFERDESLLHLGLIKSAQFFLSMETLILKEVKPLFASLLPSIRKLWLALYPTICITPCDYDGNASQDVINEPANCCDAFIAIFEAAILEEIAASAKEKGNVALKESIEPHPDGSPSKKARK